MRSNSGGENGDMNVGSGGGGNSGPECNDDIDGVTICYPISNHILLSIITFSSCSYSLGYQSITVSLPSNIEIY